MKTFLHGVRPMVFCLFASLIFTVAAENQCGGLENRYICDITDPQVFHICLGENKFRMQCPGVLNFNAKSQVCDWPASGLCPYDGYAGLDDDAEDEPDATDFYDTDSFEADDLQIILPKATPPPVTRNPFANHRNYNRDIYGDNRYYSYDVQSYGNVHENANVKSRDRVFQNYPRASVYRYQQPSRAAVNQYRSSQPYSSNMWVSQRRQRNRFVKSGRSFSPYSPPVDSYSYHLNAKQTGPSRRQQEASRRSETKSKSAVNNWRGQINSNAAAVNGRIQSKSDVRSTLARSPASVAANVARPRPERSQIKVAPSWVSRHFNDGRATQQQADQPRRDQLLTGSKQKHDSGKVQIRNNHWTNSLGLSRMPDTYPKQNLSPQKSIPIPFERASKSKDVSFRASSYDPSKTVSNEISKPKNRQVTKKSQRVFHSKNLNKRIYPYRPGKTPAAASFSNKFAMVQKKGYKPSQIGSYIKSVSKYSKKPGKCSTSWCKLPNCRCIGSDIPGNLPKSEVPMMVMLTFDDGVNHVNFNYYRKIFNGSIRNPNGCSIKGTFFVSGDSTEYGMVRALTKNGHEIASHTLSHRNPTTWWAKASAAQWEQEVIGMKNRLAEKSGVPIHTIQGMRAPFLQIGGDVQYSMLHENKLRYDSSMVTGDLYKTRKAPIWPFTLDLAPDSQTCNLTPCPQRSYPGLWEVPLIRWYGSNNFACAMPDACTIGSGTKGTLAFLEDNFNRHYQSNKAPLGIFIHASWFKRKNGNFEGLVHFLRSLVDREDVWILSVSQVLDWIQNPTNVNSVAGIPSWQC